MLEYDKLLSKYGFKFNLRRYTKVSYNNATLNGGGLNFVASLTQGHNFSGASKRLSFAIESAAQIAIAANLTVGRYKLKRREGRVVSALEFLPSLRLAHALLCFALLVTL